VFSLCLVASAETTLAERFEWLLGNWTKPSEKRIIYEHWTIVSDDILRAEGSMSDSKGLNKKTTETILLVRIGEEIFYIAKAIQNEFPVAFKLVSSSKKEAVFENLSHDFPRRIHYTLEADGALRADVTDGADRGFTIQFSLGE
jgi:hypothetical protein